MSLSGALNSAVSGLNSQASALAMIATNLANSSTVGYKSVNASFSTMLNGGGGRAGAVGGVNVRGLTDVAAQGLPVASTRTTHMAISGNGFFVTTSAPGGTDLTYTRNGEFDLDLNGNIYNEGNGQFLQGWPTDKDGTVLGGASTGSLQTLNVNDYSSLAGPTTEISLKNTNLPATAAAGAAFPTTMEVFDSLGNTGIVTVTWTKLAAVNTWTATMTGPMSPQNADGSGGVPLGNLTPNAAQTVTFNPNGTLKTPTDPIDMNIAWNTGAAPSDITLDLGEVDARTGLGQYAPDGEPLVSLDYEKDGTPYTTLSTIEMGEGGTVNAIYENGQVRTIYRVAIATFENSNRLTALSGGLYRESGESGSAAVGLAEQDGAGKILGQSLEASTTDTNKEFANMMAAQQAYSGSAQIMTAANDMFDTLIGAVR